jgi:hypothetical protein
MGGHHALGGLFLTARKVIPKKQLEKSEKKLNIWRAEFVSNIVYKFG